MHETMIIAKMDPADADDVAAVFGRYDATSMPHEIGVRHRSLFQFHGIYVHLVGFDRPPAEAMQVAQSLPAFRAVSDDLKPYIEAYSPTWRSPQDAMARRFYHWTSSPE
ncbi:TcmI family type II polyketide cyclase [Modestobacter sp. VKM Ac-2983]|uniref:TcmI family type II polyketide cyclase n=1 Tax=Modestobacter sp. VKM Ac-2983 TaxID=3004137 RepID=UPI0022AB9B43|nr:TcmI family type II polyketide cyclase [Modestobacter sp. VKM Ac-2983]MCZ2807090.1 TcmI family type II polyketide cyclase [Modestobacter sp. VKM Ac-2983]